MPFHGVCFKILAQVLRYKTSMKEGHWNPDNLDVDKDILFTTMSLLATEGQMALNLNYFELDEHKNYRFWVRRKDEQVSYYT
jgi:hypothetical protein